MRRRLQSPLLDGTKVYDGLAFSGNNGVTYDGFITGEDESVLGGTLMFGGSAQGAKNAGTYAITPGGLTAGNYAITFANGALTITPKALTVSANDAAKVYDGIGFSGGNGVSYDGFIAGEDGSVLGGTLTFAGSSQGARNAGQYVLTPGGLVANNYEITFVNGGLRITPRPINITARDTSRRSGLNDSGFTFDVGGGGLASGDSVSSVFTGALASEAGRAAAPGLYAILQGTLEANENYTITGFTSGTLEVTASEPLDAALGSVQGSIASVGLSSTGTMGLSSSRTIGLGSTATVGGPHAHNRALGRTRPYTSGSTSTTGGIGGDRDVGAVGGLRVVQVQSQDATSGEALPAALSSTTPRELGVLNVFVVNGGVRLPAILMENQE